MCRYKTLQQNEHGYVMRCNRCRHLHVAFGSTVLAFTQDQFYDFVQLIEEYRDLYGQAIHPDEKNIQVPTIVRTIMLVYSARELNDLAELLDKARRQLDHDKMLAFHEN